MILFQQGSDGKLILGSAATIMEASELAELSFGSIKDGELLVRVGEEITSQLFKAEARTSDPVSPVVGQIWLRTDL